MTTGSASILGSRTLLSQVPVAASTAVKRGGAPLLSVSVLSSLFSTDLDHAHMAGIRAQLAGKSALKRPTSTRQNTTAEFGKRPGSNPAAGVRYEVEVTGPDRHAQSSHDPPRIRQHGIAASTSSEG